MAKLQKNQIDNFYDFSNIDVNIEKEQKRKAKEREKRIKQRKKQTENQFDLDTETVIGLTNKNHQKVMQQEQRKMTKKQAKIEKRRKKIKRVLKFMALILIITGGIVFALVSPIFNITKINVQDNDSVSADTIISLSELTIGNNIFKFSKYKVKQNIKTNPYVENVIISRKIPGTINIKIEERVRSYNVEYLNGYAYINSQGYILELSEEKLDLPTIQGLPTSEEDMIPGNRLNSGDLEKLSIVIQIMDICKNYDIDQLITSINVENSSEYVLYMEEEKKTVYLGDSTNLNTKILYVQAIMEENKDEEGSIYVNGDFNNKLKARFRKTV